MEENKLKEILYAYSAGCLDKEDYPQLMELLNSGNELLEKELADMQKVITLIPSILEIEQPNPKVKDKVARKLLRMKEDVKTEKSPLEIPKENETAAVAVENIPEEENKGGYKNMPYVPLSEQTPDAPEYENSLVNEIQQKDLNNSNNHQTQPSLAANNEINEGFERIEYKAERKEKKSHALAYFILGFFISILLSGGVYYLDSKEIAKSKEQIAALNGQINAITTEMTNLKQNQKVLSLLQSRDSKAYNLDATELNTKGFGKLTISGEGKQGILQLYNMPALSGNQVYQLWATNKEQAVSLGAFRTSKDAEYFPIEEMPFEQSQAVSFIVTLEENGSAAAPSRKVFLSAATVKKP